MFYYGLLLCTAYDGVCLLFTEVVRMSVWGFFKYVNRVNTVYKEFVSYSVNMVYGCYVNNVYFTVEVVMLITFIVF